VLSPVTMSPGRCVATVVASVVLAFAAHEAVALSQSERLQSAAARLVPLLDLGRTEMRKVKALVDEERDIEALKTWRDQLVARMRSRDYHQFYQHDYARHWRQVGIADMLAGAVSREDYLNDASRTGFLDIFNMAGPPGRGQRIDWFAQPEDVTDWGNVEIASWSLQKKRSKVGYGCLHFGRSFVARFWETGKPTYRAKLMELMDDFVVNHHRLFWEAYARGEVHTRNRETGKFYYTDWRENVNALDTAVRARNLVVFQAGLAKCVGDSKAKEWADILGPAREGVSRVQTDALPADQMANLAISLVEHHGPKVIRFASGPCVPNQRLTALKTLLCLSATYPNFRHTTPMLRTFRINMDNILADNYLPDGGSLEQSFNYNHGELRELEVILASFGGDAPSFAEALRERVQARRAMDDGLRTPLGGLPQVGNHSSFTRTGKDVWSSPEALATYQASRTREGKLHCPEEQDYLSKGYPYSGYYAMRGGWKRTDPYLFFMAGRPQAGHFMHDSNSIQITAHGRNLVVCDGPPTYGYRHTPEAEYAAFAVDEHCGWKANTVLVDGKCQARDEPRHSRAPQTPVRCRWHTSPAFDLVDNLCDRGYWKAREPHGAPDHSVTHRRTVILVRAAGFWVMEDRMNGVDDTVRTYSQVWNFPPKIVSKEDYVRRHIDGFAADDFELQPNQRRFATAAPNGPNLEFFHLGPATLTYQKYYGDRETLRGWFAPGLGSVCAAPDVHAEWTSAESDRLVTLLLPRDNEGIGPVLSVERRTGEGWFGFDSELRIGGRVSFRSGTGASELRIGDVVAMAGGLLLYVPNTGPTAGVVTGVTALSVNGTVVATEDDYVEFTIAKDGSVETHAIPLQRSPLTEDHPPFLASEPVPTVSIVGEDGLDVRYTPDGTDPGVKSSLYTGPFDLSAPATVKARYFRAGRPLPFVASREYRPVFYEARPADYPLMTALESGLSCAELRHAPGIRLYDLMRQTPVREFLRPTWQLAAFTKETNYGLKQMCLIRIPRRGFWRFHLARGEAATAGIVIRNPVTDIHRAPIARVGWWAEKQSGSIALEAGYHHLEIQYGCFYNTRNGLEIDVEGPGTSCQPLPDSWLFQTPK
jgi:hypothetical protein